MIKEYILFKDGDKDPPQNEPIDIELEDKETFEKLKAKVILYSSADALPEGDLVWLQQKSGWKPEDRPDNPWRVKILEIFPDEEVPEIEIKEKKVRLGSRGDMIRSLIREREKDKGEEK
jgi:hypothetical protein